MFLYLAILSLILLTSRATGTGGYGTRPLLRSPGHGGSNGTTFDDVSVFHNDSVIIVGLSSINISYGNQVDAIQVTYKLSNFTFFSAPKHGTSGKTSVNVSLSGYEYISKIEGKTDGKVVNQLTITTVGPEYEKTIYGPFGKGGILDFSFEGLIFGFHGRAGNLLSNIGVYYLEALKKSDEYGGPGGKGFDDKVHMGYSPITGITVFYIYYGDHIMAIQCMYRNLPYRQVLGMMHGKRGGALGQLNLDEGEQVIEINGSTDDSYVSELNVVTRKMNGSYAYYGPYGKLGLYPFSFSGNIFALTGSSGDMLNRIGVYYN